MNSYYHASLVVDYRMNSCSHAPLVLVDWPESIIGGTISSNNDENYNVIVISKVDDGSINEVGELYTHGVGLLIQILGVEYVLEEDG